MLEKTTPITTEDEVPPEAQMNVNLSQQALNVTVGDVNITTEKQNITDVPNVPEVQEPIDIADLPTQKLETISQFRKRTADYELPVRTELVFYGFPWKTRKGKLRYRY